MDSFVPKLIKRLLNWRYNSTLERALASEREFTEAEPWHKTKSIGPTHPDAVFFGTETIAKIISIDGEVICYQDSGANSHKISLRECSRGDSVGFRYLDAPPWTVTLFDPASTRMEFESYDMVYAKLLGPLGRNGWRTFDCTQRRGPPKHNFFSGNLVDDDTKELYYLAYYLVYYFGSNLTDDERSLLWACHLTPMIRKKPQLEEQRKFQINEKAKLTIADHGLEQTICTTADEILSRNGDEIFINRCPRCERLVRTPKARLCLWCGHNWKNTKE